VIIAEFFNFKGSIMSAIRERLELRLPYALIPTNLAAAFTTPAPPSNFDPRTASASSLLKHGFLWRRPGKGDSPTLRGAWQRLIRHWRAEDYIIPRLEPQVGRTHVLRGVKRLADGSFQSSSWAGAAVLGNWTSVIGVWVVPTVSQPLVQQGTEGGWDSLSWVGLDGVYGSDYVLQAGVDQRVSPQGQASYVPWFEWYVPPPTNLPPGTPTDQNGYPLKWIEKYPYIYRYNITNVPVNPGDTVFCSIQYVGGTAGNVYFANFTTGQHFPITLAPPCSAILSGNSAEWIMEAPDGGVPITSLPTFSPVVFTDAFCCDANVTGNPATGNIFNIEGVDDTFITSVTVGDLTCIIEDPLATTVPDVFEMNVSLATHAVETAALVPEFLGTGSWVSSQSPIAGATVNRGSAVQMHLSNITLP
jgi:hypothetical protein